MLRTVYKSPIGEQYTKLVHSSGLEIYICEKPEYTSSYALFGTRYGSVDTCFAAGDEKEQQVPEGIAHFLEHKLFESEDGDAFTRFAETGASANAFTSFDRTCYLFSCSDRFTDNLTILMDFVQHPYFTPETVKKEQGIIGQEIRMYDDSPSWCVFFNLLQALYVNNPVRIDIAGTTESIAEITDELLYRCYHTFYDLSNMFLCVCGRVSERDIIDIVEKSIINNRATAIKRLIPNEPEYVRTGYVEKHMEVSLPLFSIGYKLSGEKQSFKDLLCLSMALEVLTGDSSPFTKRLTDEGLINDEFDSEVFSGNGYAAVLFSGESQNPRAVREALTKELASVKQNGLDRELLEAVRRGMYGDAVRRYNDVQSVAMQMTECAVNGFDMFEELSLLQTITAEEVEAALNTMREECSAMSVILPQNREG